MLRKALLLAIALTPCFAWSAPTGVGQLLARGSGAFFAEEPPMIASAPFSAEVKTQSVTTFVDGNRIVRTNTVHFFRDGKGRTRTERGDGPGRTIVINDPVAGERFMIQPQYKVVLALKVPDLSRVSRTEGAQTNSGVVVPTDDDLSPFGLLGFRMGIGASLYTEASSETTSLGNKTIGGLATTGARLVRTIPSGVLGNENPITSTVERWMSVDLGIAVQITQTSSIGGELTLNLVQVTRAEPNASLFNPPADYTRHDMSLPNPVMMGPGAGPNTSTLESAVRKDGNSP